MGWEGAENEALNEVGWGVGFCCGEVFVVVVANSMLM